MEYKLCKQMVERINNETDMDLTVCVGPDFSCDIYELIDNKTGNKLVVSMHNAYECLSFLKGIYFSKGWDYYEGIK
jgi:hypothetical protein